MVVWLDLVSSPMGWSLIDTGRLDDIVQGMSHPTSQYPSLVYFAGNNKRLVALQSLFPLNNITRRGPAGLARLHLSTTTASTEHPIVFADSGLYVESGGIHVDINTLKVMVILTNPTAHYDPELLHDTCHSAGQHASITVLNLQGRHSLSPKAAYEPLRRLLLNELAVDRSERKAHGLLFSASHLRFLWGRTLRDGVLTLPTASINCLRIAREQLPIRGQWKDGLVELLKRACKVGCSNNNIHQFVASALLMDAYLPEMHCFRPDTVFNALYHEYCSAAWGRQLGKDMDEHCTSILSHFIQFASLLSPVTSSVRLQQATLNNFFARCAWLSSTTTCLFCLCRPPEHMLGCGHSMCDTCISIFGTRASAEYHVDISQCPICLQPFHLTVRQLPPTKRPVIMTLDRGGVRGIVSLGLLQALEKRLGEIIQVSQIPDLVTGTSVGGIIRLDFACNGTSAQESYTRFPIFARRVFPPEGTMLSLWNNKQYSSETLDATLQELYPPERRIFDISEISPTRCRVAITANRVSDGRICVLANYRGVEQSVSGAPWYQFLIPGENTETLFYGKYIALEECRVIWSSTKVPDLHISVGTGYVPCTSHDSRGDDTRACSRIREGALLRVAVPLWASMDGEEGHKEHPRTHRLNHPFNALPWLDASDIVTELAEILYSVSDEVVRVTLATLFFFELDEQPMDEQDCYCCRGSIFCARPQAWSIVQQILINFPSAQFQISHGDDLGPISDDQNGCLACGYYRKKVVFAVTSLEDKINLVVANGSVSHPIGGFPKTIKDVLREQQSDAVFGRVDHQPSSLPALRMCYCARGVK
ncbi:hypothetical protein BDV23DRAFT_191948 [Aspergillus alliaceus]|uniref:FabD/lysophospholipase-like protein n=1 Tax=Petromyces alliaceus TaxID=209559 RepID=A0A5N7BQQ7_PETAA|nr:hypothetical protein BDV23DRAFT_191948 [Aspergillus alliaceus]